jgi:hypothetical protein
MKSKCAVWIAAILFASTAHSVLAESCSCTGREFAACAQTSPVPPAPPSRNPPPTENPLPTGESAHYESASESCASADGAERRTRAELLRRHAPVDTIEKRASRRAESPSRKSAKKSIEPAPAPGGIRTTIRRGGRCRLLRSIRTEAETRPEAPRPREPETSALLLRLRARGRNSA